MKKNLFTILLLFFLTNNSVFANTDKSFLLPSENDEKNKNSFYLDEKQNQEKNIILEEINKNQNNFKNFSIEENYIKNKSEETNKIRDFEASYFKNNEERLNFFKDLNYNKEVKQKLSELKELKTPEIFNNKVLEYEVYKNIFYSRTKGIPTEVQVTRDFVTNFINENKLTNSEEVSKFKNNYLSYLYEKDRYLYDRYKEFEFQNYLLKILEQEVFFTSKKII